MLRCRDVTYSAYYCVQLFDSIGFELYAKDLQEVRGPQGLGVYCTLDLQKARDTGKTVLIAEFKANTAERGVPGISDLLVSSGGNGENWRERGYAGVLYSSTEICIRVECIRVLYRREWQGEISWPALKRICDAMEDPPLALDSDAAQSDAAWAKSMERLKSYSDNQVQRTKDQLCPVWHKHTENAGSSCTMS
ncbi:unnamed protein product [Effrenium voratum]|nr:unnamed protein product [Effrenium voratum]